MKNYWVFLTISWAVLASLSCTRFNESLLTGKWKGASLEEEGNRLPIQAKEIQLIFAPNGTYTYHSTLNYKEAGIYYLDGSLLYRRDTLNAASREMLVEILRLDRDSLFFRMHENDRQRTMKLYRVR